MTSNQSNTEHLHNEGVVNKAELTAEHIQAIDSLSAEEVDQLKAIHKNANKDNDTPVGIVI
ncbi:hypothetical protein [Thalassotalea sp. G2M2-11]|uniref:hypothetical protein n=1 Tax=Thalassotalea sp. G2M2-11 TaxID=2787627 RepID=UPI0019CF8965|nr:hypothetical protein [Thalassotalea sp. G2M2-11]